MNQCCNMTNKTAGGQEVVCSTDRKETAFFKPAADIVETPTGFSIVIDVPGATREDIETTFEEGVLTMEARVPERGVAGDAMLRREYAVGRRMTNRSRGF
ncbi:MAG: Hsp20/alpha crystallin family protein [Planctomycetota bacterium]|nr:Hsp20/alpha crystallin family protein [Planctomycetota bacterium]